MKKLDPRISENAKAKSEDFIRFNERLKNIELNNSNLDEINEMIKSFRNSNNLEDYTNITINTNKFNQFAKDIKRDLTKNIEMNEKIPMLRFIEEYLLCYLEIIKKYINSKSEGYSSKKDSKGKDEFHLITDFNIKDIRLDIEFKINEILVELNGQKLYLDKLKVIVEENFSFPFSDIKDNKYYLKLNKLTDYNTLKNIIDALAYGIEKLKFTV